MRARRCSDGAARGYLLDHAYSRQMPTTPDAVIYKEGQRFIDFSRAEVRAWWWDAHRPLIAHGIAGWWLDGGEGPPAGTALAAGEAAIVHNRFDLWRHQSFAEGEARDRSDQRAFLLCRSGGPGMARFGAVPWSGDINTTFETLEQQIRIGLNLGLSGIPHWGTDAGGFYSVAPDQSELLVPWLQFAAFCTLFRAHGHVWQRHVPWAYGETIEAICRAIIELRYRMLPYSYTLVAQARRDGLPTRPARGGAPRRPRHDPAMPPAPRRSPPLTLGSTAQRAQAQRRERRHPLVRCVIEWNVVMRRSAPLVQRHRVWAVRDPAPHSLCRHCQVSRC
jgi:alpha-glucosidase (family GH31 glycosyl hydrolase)